MRYRSMRVAWAARWALSAAGAALLGGCALVVDFSDYHVGDEASSSAGGGGAAGSGGAGGLGGAGGTGGAGGCSGDLLTDKDNCGACGRSCQGGACVGGQCQAFEVAKTGAAFSSYNHLIIDPADGTVYWSDNGTILSVSGGAAPEMPKTIVSGIGADFIAVDATNLYWTVFAEQGSVWTVVKGGTMPNTLATGQQQPVGLAVSQGLVYWAAYQQGEIRRAPADASMPAEPVKTGEMLPFFIAVDGAEVYWSFRGDGVMGGIKALMAVEPLVSGVSSPGGIALDATHVYWVGQDGSVHKTPRAGGGVVTELASPEAPAASVLQAGELVVDATHVYWTGKNDKMCIGKPCSQCQPCGRIYRAPKDGPPASVEVFAEDETNANWGMLRSIAMTDSAIYWTTGDDKRLFRKVKPTPSP